MLCSFLLLPTEAACRAVSAALYAMALPPSDRRAVEEQQWALPWMKHPTKDEWALIVPQNWELRISTRTAAHLAADDYGMRSELQTLLGSRCGNWNSLRAKLLNRASGTRRLDLSADLLPELLPALVRTRAQMDADGWFPQVTL